MSRDKPQYHAVGRAKTTKFGYVEARDTHLLCFVSALHSELMFTSQRNTSYTLQRSKAKLLDRSNIALGAMLHPALRRCAARTIRRYS